MAIGSNNAQLNILRPGNSYMAINQPRLTPRTTVPIATPMTSQKVLTSRSVRTCSSRCRQTSASGLMNAEATTSTGISTRVAKNSAISRQRLRRKEKTEAPFNGASVRIKMLSVRINSLITSPIHQLDRSRLQFASLGNVDQIMLELAPACHQGVRLIGRVGRIFHVKVCEHA